MATTRQGTRFTWMPASKGMPRRWTRNTSVKARDSCTREGLRGFMGSAGSGGKGVADQVIAQERDIGDAGAAIGAAQPRVSMRSSAKPKIRDRAPPSPPLLVVVRRPDLCHLDVSVYSPFSFVGLMDGSFPPRHLLGAGWGSRGGSSQFFVTI